MYFICTHCLNYFWTDVLFYCYFILSVSFCCCYFTMCILLRKVLWLIWWELFVFTLQIDPSMIFPLFDMDQLAYIHWYCWNKHIKVVKLPSLKVICWKLTKMWGTNVFKVARASLYPHHTSICRILQFCGATVYCHVALFKKIKIKT